MDKDLRYALRSLRETPGLYGHRHPHARVRYRRVDGDLQRRRWRLAARVAVPTGRRDHAASRSQRTQRAHIRR